MTAADLDGWFARRTSRAEQHPVDELVDRRRAAGVTVSVVLPARNEQDTVAGVVASATSLQPHLVDEVVVMDGGSTDDTALRAAAAGARVVPDDDVPPGPPALGKGDALWRSLRVTTGDIVIFADTDVRNPRPAVFSGLLAPLLTDPAVAFVKAAYDRPLEVRGVWSDTGGGRVTELLARPLINLAWPELAGVAQPLSGEYAGHRRLLERLPFFTGYGVELGLLVDVWRTAGLDAVAQVDIGVRQHRNQPLPALSRMAYGILQVARRRAAECAADHMPASHPYRQVLRGADGRLTLTATPVEVVERPPHRP